jgi:hypothetical protein
MVRSINSDDLLRCARDAAGTSNVREAVRDLTLHALRSRQLTASHIATVARTVGEGIESSGVSPSAPVRDVHRGAWAGLEEAIDRALYALELAAREIVEGRTALSRAERDQVLAEIADLERSLGTGWNSRPRIVPAALKARIAKVNLLLRQTAPVIPGEDGLVERGPDAGGRVSLVASGILLGLSAGLGEPVENAGP